MPEVAETGETLARPAMRSHRFRWVGRAWVWFYIRAVRHVPWMKILRFSVSTLIAAALWFLLKLNHEYSMDINFPLEVTDPPVGYRVSGQSERYMRVRVRGKGYALQRLQTFNSFSPLQINLQSIEAAEGVDTVSHQCLSRGELERLLAPQIPSNLTLEHFVTERLCYDLSRMGHRKLPVAACVHYSLREQYAQFQPLMLSADSILAVGPAAELAKMEYAYSDTVNLGEISETERFRLTFSPLDGVQFQPSELTCTIPVSQFTRKRMVVPIRVENADSLGQVTLLPGAVEVTCDVPLSSFASVKEDDFTLRVRFYRGITPERLLVELVKMPPEARNVAFSPQYVSYLIAK